MEWGFNNFCEAAMLRIGLDIGHSSVKAVYSHQDGSNRGSVIFPTLVIPAFRLLDERAARAAKADTVSYQGEWFVGDTAALQGKLASFSGQDRDWVFSTTHDVLVISALQRIQEASGLTLNGAILTVGLPVQYYAEQRANLRQRLSSVLSQCFGKDVAESIVIRVQTQAYGPVYLIATKEDGRPTDRDLKSESWGVVEIGHFTTDFILISEEQIVEHSSGSSEGFRMVYERLMPEFSDKGYSTSPKDMTNAIISGKLMHFGKPVDVSQQVKKAVDASAQSILSDVQRLFGAHMSRLNGVVVAGGAAPAIAPNLIKQYPHTMMLPNPRYAVADGFRRHSCAVAIQMAAAR
jgi:plasmid segregation protein ParM